MWKLRKYMMKYWYLFVLAILFIFGQVATELALPDAMSNIVSNGIQSGGFVNGVAEVLSKESYDALLDVSSSKDQKLIKTSYTLTNKKDLSEDVKDRFKNIKEDVYVLKEDVDQDELSDSLSKRIIVVNMLTHANMNSEQFKSFKEMAEKQIAYLTAKGEKEQSSLLKKALKEGNALFFVKQMPSSKQKEIYSAIETQIENMGETNLNIAAGSAVKNEYKKLGGDTDQVQNSYIKNAGVRMLMVALVGAVASIVSALFASLLASKIARDLRVALFKKVESFSQEEMNQFSTASLITRSTNDITQIQSVITMFVRMICYAPVLGIGALLRAIEGSASMTWVIAIVIVIIFVILVVTFMIAMPKFKIIQSLIDRLNLRMRENLSGVLVIRAFGNEKEAERRFDESNKDLMKINLFVNRMMSSLMPIMMFLMNAVSVVIIYVGAKQIDLGNIAIGDMMAFLQYSIMVIMGFLMIAVIAIIVPRASISASRIAEVLDTDCQIKEASEVKDFNEEEKGVISFDHVSFSYPGADAPVLNDISFVAHPGKTTAFIGSTGSGKSTLINLIPRFYDVTSGQVKVNGVDVRDTSLYKLRESIGMVPQKGLLFSGTIRSNLTFGTNKATDDELKEYLRIAQADEFVNKFEDGLDHPISQGGQNVSGGQKQRLSIARALAKDPDILIFDDSFSALDFKTDAALRKELKTLCDKKQTTVLIVGQRIASIMHADQIIVLDEGRIVGKGTHEQLLSTCQIYQEIAQSQLTKEELTHA